MKITKKTILISLSVIGLIFAGAFYSLRRPVEINRIADGYSLPSPPPAGCQWEFPQCIQAPCDPILNCANQTKLTFDPNTITTDESGDHTADIILTTPLDSRPTAASITLTYDDSITITSIKPASIMTQVLASPDISTTSTSFAYGVSPDYYTTPYDMTPTLTIATVSFHINSDLPNDTPHPHQLKIDYLDPIVAALNTQDNIIQGHEGLNIIIERQFTIMGDINLDNIVDIYDYSLFVEEYEKTGYSIADFNQDEIVNIYDYSIFVENYGNSLEIPVQYCGSSADCPPNYSCQPGPADCHSIVVDGQRFRECPAPRSRCTQSDYR
ncbi:hypothetical protein HN588_00465 [Candidatus Bathyarchaeota archaeon]|nr:hypothetical protein [Candidatus Bathyarchaeota archaeon]